MSDWSRRQVLRALQLGVTAPLVAPLITACGGRGKGPRVVARGPRPVDQLRRQLRDLVADLSRDYVDVTAHAQLRTRGGAAFDASERGADRHRESALVIGVTSGGVRFEQATTDVSAAGVDRAAAWLRTRAERDPAAVPAELAAPVDHAVPVARDPMNEPPRDWLDRVDLLYRRGLRAGGSRIVYRGAYLTIDDCTALFLGRGRDLSQRLVRTRAGVLLVAWTGTAPSADEAVRAGTLGLEATEVETDALEAAAERALAQLTARDAPEGEMQLVLDPTIAGLIAAEALAPALAGPALATGESPLRIGELLGSPELSLVDDPTLAGGYGSYYFDADGVDARPVRLLDRGTVATPLADRASAAALGMAPTGSGRRPHPTAAVRALPSNLAFTASDRSTEQLIGEVDRGLVAEGALALQLDPRSGRLVIRAARGRGVDGGKLTGARYGGLEIRTSLRALLSGARVGAGPIVRQPRLIGATPASTGGPHLAGRGEVRRG